MGTAFCRTCKAKSTSEDKDTAISLLNHAVGRSRGIDCGGNLARVETTGFATPKETKITTPTPPKEIKSIPPKETKESKYTPKETKSIPKESKKASKSVV